MKPQVVDHIPVLIEPILEYSKNFFPNNAVVFDATFGRGGYSRAFLLNNYNVFANDADSTTFDVIQQDTLFQSKISSQELVIIHGNFAETMAKYQNKFDIVVADLGFSSYQLTGSKRGFSYMNRDEMLDLRYNADVGKPCYELIQSVKDVDNLGRILFTYSGEPYSKPIAKKIFDFKAKNLDKILTVGNMVDLVESVVPKYKNKIAVLSRIWQSLRIWTNNEFENLELFLKYSLTALKKNGLLMVVSFHSLEDKIVAGFMREKSKKREIDDYGNKVSDFNLLTNHPIVPSQSEINSNVRSRSAKLRILNKLY